MSLLDKKCVPCEGGVPPLTPEQIKPLMKQISGWLLVDDKKLQKVWLLKDFQAAIGFINKVALIADTQSHHPTIENEYNKVKLTLSTHAIGGLSENDFILAAKIDTLG